MKLVAIGGRGSRKDFIDLYFFLQAGGSLESIFDLVRRRFENVDYNEYHLLKSLVYFEDAEAEPMPRMLREASWSAIKKTIVCRGEAALPIGLLELKPHPQLIAAGQLASRSGRLTTPAPHPSRGRGRSRSTSRTRTRNPGRPEDW